MIFRFVLICFIIVVLWSLFMALKYFIFPKYQDSLSMVKALSYRIGFSLVLFCLLICGWYFNWWNPHLL